MDEKWIRHKRRNLSAQGLKKTRFELHQALQLVGAVGRSFSPDSVEDEFGSLIWNGDTRCLTSVAIGDNNKITAAMDMERFEINLLAADNKKLSSIKCRNRTYKNLTKKLRKNLDALGLEGAKLNLKLPYEIPVYATTSNKKFKGKNSGYFREMTNLFQNAALIISSYQNQFENASELRCWPHHFDIATSITFPKPNDEKDYMGIGFSPGDENYNRAYYYINLWPAPNTKPGDLPTLDKGKWNTEGWFGATLDTKLFKKLKTAEDQHLLVKNFYKVTVEKITQLIALNKS